MTKKLVDENNISKLYLSTAVLQRINVLPFDKDVVKQAVLINRQLKQKRKQIDLADLFIAATAIANNLSFATLNRKHFERIERLHIVE
ncbi:MAG: type II toxin-antitoxin system VapC family toxin [Bacteroidota bacterium]